MLTWKFVSPLLLVLVVLWVGITLPLQPIIVTDTRIVQYQFEHSNAPDCQQSAEVQALQVMANQHRMPYLQQALVQLHDTSNDPLWQPLLEVLSPKTIYVDAKTFAQTSNAAGAIALTRYTRRVDLTWSSAEFSPRLTYRINLRARLGTVPEIDVQSPEHQQGPVAVLKPERLSNDVHLDHLHISSCAAQALQRFYTARPWMVAPTSEQGFCRLHNEHVTALRFYFTCPSPRAAARLAY